MRTRRRRGVVMMAMGAVFGMVLPVAVAYGTEHLMSFMPEELESLSLVYQSLGGEDGLVYDPRVVDGYGDGGGAMDGVTVMSSYGALGMIFPAFVRYVWPHLSHRPAWSAPPLIGVASVGGVIYYVHRRHVLWSYEKQILLSVGAEPGAEAGAEVSVPAAESSGAVDDASSLTEKPSGPQWPDPNIPLLGPASEDGDKHESDLWSQVEGEDSPRVRAAKELLQNVWQSSGDRLRLVFTQAHTLRRQMVASAKARLERKPLSYRSEILWMMRVRKYTIFKQTYDFLRRYPEVLPQQQNAASSSLTPQQQPTPTLTLASTAEAEGEDHVARNVETSQTLGAFLEGLVKDLRWASIELHAIYYDLLGLRDYYSEPVDQREYQVLSHFLQTGLVYPYEQDGNGVVQKMLSEQAFERQNTDSSRLFYPLLQTSGVLTVELVIQLLDRYARDLERWHRRDVAILKKVEILQPYEYAEGPTDLDQRFVMAPVSSVSQFVDYFVQRLRQEEQKIAVLSSILTDAEGGLSVVKDQQHKQRVQRAFERFLSNISSRRDKYGEDPRVVARVLRVYGNHVERQAQSEGLSRIALQQEFVATEKESKGRGLILSYKVIDDVLEGLSWRSSFPADGVGADTSVVAVENSKPDPFESDPMEESAP